MPHCRRHALSPFHPSFLSVRARIRAVQVVGGMRMPRVSIPHSKLRRLHRRETVEAICRGPLSGATLLDLEVKRGKSEKVKKKRKNKKIKNNPYERATEMRGHCRDGVHDPWKSGCTSFLFFFLFFLLSRDRYAFRWKTEARYTIGSLWGKGINRLSPLT